MVTKSVSINNLGYWFKIFLKQFGVLGIFRLMFYPITLLITTPFKLIISLWNCRVILKKKMNHFCKFDPSSGFNNLFYWTIYENLKKFGRGGKSKYIGLGSYPMSNFFYVSKSILYLYKNYNILFLLICMFSWLFSHLIWINEIQNINKIYLIIILALFSTTFYLNLFKLQNYNAFSWAFFPLALYSIIYQKKLLLLISTIGISLGGITGLFLLDLILFFYFIINFNFNIILTSIPANLIILIRFYYLFKQEGIIKTILSIFKAIGVTKKDVKYVRKDSKINIPFIYFTLIFLQFIIFGFLSSTKHLNLLIFVFIIYLINSLISRFADKQSMLMLIFSVMTLIAINSNSKILLISYWIAISPIPLLSAFETTLKNKKFFDTVPVYKPFNVKRIIKDLDKNLINSIKKDSKILFCYNDPNGRYEKIFDGYRRLNETLVYLCNLKEILYIPNWWSIFQFNNKKDIEFWGNDHDSIQKNTKKLKVDYIIRYNYDEIPNRINNFKLIKIFNWKKYSYLEELNKKNILIWALYKKI